MFVTVSKPHVANYPDPLTFEKGSMLHIGGADPDFPAWFWCRSRAGKEGRVHHSFFVTGDPSVGTRPYSARELTVAGGESGTLLESLDGWSEVLLSNGDKGWIPTDHLAGPTREELGRRPGPC